MRLIVNLFAVLSLIALIAFSVGCSDENTTIGATIVGDTTDAQFQVVSGLFEEMDLDNSYGVSSEFSFDLLETTFPAFASHGIPRDGAMRRASTDSSVVTISNYAYTNGWHVFTFSAVFFEIINQVMDTAGTLSGVDSIKVLANGVAMIAPDSTADALNIRAHFDFAFTSVGFTYSGDHLIDIGFDITSNSPALTVDGTISQDIVASISDSTLADTCNLTMNVSQIISNFTFPIDSTGEPQSCPTAGTSSTTVTINMTCGTGSSFDGLGINGSWNVTAQVIASDNIKVTYTDGTTTWSITEACNSGSAQATSGFIVLVGGN